MAMSTSQVFTCVRVRSSSEDCVDQAMKNLVNTSSSSSSGPSAHLPTDLRPLIETKTPARAKPLQGAAGTNTTDTDTSPSTPYEPIISFCCPPRSHLNWTSLSIAGDCAEFQFSLSHLQQSCLQSCLVLQVASMARDARLGSLNTNTAGRGTAVERASTSSETCEELVTARLDVLRSRVSRTN